MRTAWWLVLLFVLPLASGFHSPTQLLEPEVDGSEELLRLSEGVWTSQEWAEIEQYGVVPLRIVSPETLLVWQPKQSVLPPYVEVIPFEDAVWKEGLSDGGWDFVRLVFEPNLPRSVKERLLASVALLDAQPIDGDGVVESILPPRFN